jgi:hypothetical protein
MDAFDPMTDVPENDEQALLALERQDEVVTSCLRGLYRIYREEGMTILDAYEKVLLIHIGGRIHDPSRR